VVIEPRFFLRQGTKYVYRRLGRKVEARLWELVNVTERILEERLSAPDLCCATAQVLFFLTSAARRQRFGPKKQRSARVLARVLKDFL
jgi:hypothetical protein